jgi:hypothetical protein
MTIRETMLHAATPAKFCEGCAEDGERVPASRRVRILPQDYPAFSIPFTLSLCADCAAHYPLAKDAE